MFFESFDHGEEGCAGVVPGHGEEDVVSSHSHVAGVYVGECVGSAVSDVLGGVGVGVGDGEVVFGFVWVGVGFEGCCFGPAFLPFLFYVFPVDHVG